MTATMKNISNLSRLRRIAVWATLSGSLSAPVLLSPAYSSTPPTVKRTQHQAARKTTDPPVASRGKLGQDLFLAIDHRDTAEVEALLKRGADPDSRNGLEFTPLYIAAASHQPAVVRALLKAGADPNADSPYGTPLCFASASANLDGANVLLARGVDVNAVRTDRITPLMLAANTGLPNLVDLLIKHKAAVNAKDNDGATALLFAARQGNTPVSRILLDAGAQINALDSHRQSPLMAASVNGRLAEVKMLLDGGADPNIRDAKGRTALALAAQFGEFPDVVSALVKGGANPKLADARGRTAISLAAAHGHAETVAVLQGSETASSPETLRLRSPREAVRDSLKLLQGSMLEFNRNTACISCHQEGLGRVTTGVARDHGFPLDQAVQRAQLDRIKGTLFALRPLHAKAVTDPEAMKHVPLIEINEVSTGDSWLLTGMAAHHDPPNEATAAMALVLGRQQAADGHWSFSVPRIPMQSSFVTVTALAVRSLGSYGPKAHGSEIAERIRLAKTWLLDASAKNSEDRASRLLGLHWAGASADEKRKAVDEILADQRPDGGWSQTSSLPSARTQPDRPCTPFTRRVNCR